MERLKNITKATKEMIRTTFSQAVNFANNLEVTGIDPEFESLFLEKHLESK